MIIMKQAECMLIAGGTVGFTLISPNTAILLLDSGDVVTYKKNGVIIQFNGYDSVVVDNAVIKTPSLEKGLQVGDMFVTSYKTGWFWGYGYSIENY